MCCVVLHCIALRCVGVCLCFVMIGVFVSLCLGVFVLVCFVCVVCEGCV